MLTNYDDKVFINAFNDYYLDLFGEDFSYQITAFYRDYHSKTEELLIWLSLSSFKRRELAKMFVFFYGYVKLPAKL